MGYTTWWLPWHFYGEKRKQLRDLTQEIHAPQLSCRMGDTARNHLPVSLLLLLVLLVLLMDTLRPNILYVVVYGPADMKTLYLGEKMFSQITLVLFLPGDLSLPRLHRPLNWESRLI